MSQFTVIVTLTILLAASALGQTEGWASARWGMSQKEILGVFKGEAVRPARSTRLNRQFGDRLAEIVIDRAQIGSVPVQANFFFDNTGGLDKILLRPASSRSPQANEWFKHLENWMEHEYGQPSLRGRSSEGDSFLSAWIMPKTVIELSLLDASAIDMWLLVVQFVKNVGQSPEAIVGKLTLVRGRHFPKQTITMTKPVESKTLAFQDNTIAISFGITRQALGFEVLNKSRAPIKIDWDQMSFVETDGRATRIIHSGVRLIERDRPQAPTVIPPGAKITDSITPVNRIQYEKGWTVLPLFAERGQEAQAVCGKKVQLFIPLQIDSVPKNHSFEFAIDCDQ